VLSEGYEGEVIFSCPKLYFPIITSSSNIGTVGRISKRVQVKEVSLLFQDICLRFPFPDEQLPKFSACKSNPLTTCVDADRINLALTDLETVNAFESVNVEDAEHTVTLPNDHDPVGLGNAG
jgi:hypothetical protein